MYRVLQPFEFFEPTTIKEVVDLVDGEKARVLAGGVDLVLQPNQFGTANIVFAALVSKSGDIYDEGFLEKLYGLTDQIDKIEGVDHGQVASITSIKVRDQGIDEEGQELGG